jgi:predicted metal-dependent hydrolase
MPPPSRGRAQPPASDPPIAFVRRRGTRHYVLRVMDDGGLRVTIPWWGTQREARRFVESQRPWIARQLARRAARGVPQWLPGRQVLIDGTSWPLVADGDGRITLAGVHVADAAHPAAIRAGVIGWLRARAQLRLPAELRDLADRHGLAVSRITIRNQSSRWGSCSRGGAISLNWRLTQVPPFVREYVLVHELMHLRQMNHSARFWRLVAAVCPRYLEARRWLRREGATLFD